MDWLPTIVELCGLEPPEVKLDGRSVVPIIRSESAPTHYQSIHWAWQKSWAVRQGPWKLISLGPRNRQLVNLDDAEPERKNHIKEKPEIEKRLQALHDAWAEDVKYRDKPPF